MARTGAIDSGALDPLSRNAIASIYDLLDPPLWLVTSAAGECRGGLIATFVTRASIVDSMPRMVLGIAKHHHTWGLIETSNRFALHLLHSDQTGLVRQFSSQSGHEVDKFAGLAAERTPGGCPLIAEALAWLDCRVEERLDTGDRTLYLAAVETGGTNGQAPPLTVRKLFSTIGKRHRRMLDELFTRDSVIDAKAILQWRDERATS